ncbi:hypothetical protein G7Z17_g2368 [Cylindrodendrum hubeiense]|uniref:Uncharacterized protein n=1 Tax=Cylindrodendrum hubeiense TaxID=595255 RepID=A0A9P5LJ61_9HYPO|nr:hypothetical protein G7Z17_g2368 [Cylindrodendrum hubeiense]
MALTRSFYYWDPKSTGSVMALAGEAMVVGPVFQDVSATDPLERGSVPFDGSKESLVLHLSEVPYSLKFGEAELARIKQAMEGWHELIEL